VYQTVKSRLLQLVNTIICDRSVAFVAIKPEAIPMQAT
jgi:hypothetical protein